MPYEIIDTTQVNKSLIYDESHITIYCTFTDNGVPIDVNNATFTLKKNGVDVSLSDYQILRPLQKDNVEETGKYIVTFLSKGLSAGEYTAECSGEKPGGGSVVVTTTLTLFEIPRVQYLIDMLRSILGGKYNLDIPDKYLLFDPRKKKRWEDGLLWKILNYTVERINCYNPPTEWTLDDIPCTGHLMMGAQLYALTPITVIEDVNFFDITIPYKVNIYKGDKFKELMRIFRDQFEGPLLEWKMNYYLNNMLGDGAVAVTMQRVPVRLLRPISDQLYFHTIGW